MTAVWGEQTEAGAQHQYKLELMPKRLKMRVGFGVLLIFLYFSLAPSKVVCVCDRHRLQSVEFMCLKSVLMSSTYFKSEAKSVVC